VETGVAYGWSSFAALASLVNRNGTLYSSDMPYILQNQSEDFVGCVIPQKYRNNWDLYRFADKESLPRIFGKVILLMWFIMTVINLITAGSGHIILLFSKVRKGGIFMSDDIGDNAAFKDFCETGN
jgi:hypothetical protein